MAGHGNPTHSLGQYTDKEQGNQHGLKGAERSVPALFQGAQPTQIEQMVENKQCKRPNSQPFMDGLRGHRVGHQKHHSHRHSAVRDMT